MHRGGKAEEEREGEMSHRRWRNDRGEDCSKHCSTGKQTPSAKHSRSMPPFPTLLAEGLLWEDQSTAGGIQSAGSVTLPEHPSDSLLSYFLLFTVNIQLKNTIQCLSSHCRPSPKKHHGEQTCNVTKGGKREQEKSLVWVSAEGSSLLGTTWLTSPQEVQLFPGESPGLSPDLPAPPLPPSPHLQLKAVPSPPVPGANILVPHHTDRIDREIGEAVSKFSLLT
ncbi:hypothetical protein JZ751_006727 [Albula glossodonta]|uniref:Uncharacterized protein n=1 Tax=Albula glossodonta TaxID=121402 RepID=A0A8T2P3W4_9TELE|nr:hypothetical protein JZ751_006727 [Albula glossodonta]